MAEIHPYTGLKILYYREHRGWTLRELEARTGITHSLIAQYERLESNPSYGKCLVLSKALGVSVSALWDVSPPPASPDDLPTPSI